MKPHNTLIFLFGTFLILGLLLLTIPKEEIRISDTISFKLPSIHEIFFEDTVQYADISHLTDTTVKNIILEITSDTVVVGADTTVVIDTVRANADSLKRSTFTIQFPENNTTILYPFFKAIAELKDNPELIRILHYGDSQLEGGRITSILRKHLQKNFGGSGPGLMPIYEENSWGCQLTMEHTGEWKKHTRYGVPDSVVEISNARWGMLASISRFSPVLNDSVELPKTMYEATVTIRKKNSKIFPLHNTFSRMRIFCNNNTKPVFAELYRGDSSINMFGIDTTEQLKVIDWDLPDFTKEGFTIKFTGEDSPDIYGIALDGKTGIAIDNIPMRGSSGLEFTRISKSQLAEMYKILNVKLFILEYGVNVVPNIVDSYAYYEKGFCKNLMKLRDTYPEAPIIVIGISDMAHKNGNYYESYPNIEKIRDAQKAAAFKAGCAFWDMYEAMGGKNSMPSWVFAEPPLAQKDFTHFNYMGSKIVGEMFFNAFLKEYKEYLSLMKHE